MKKVLYIFGQLSDGDVQWLGSAGQRSVAAAGSDLIRQGQPIDQLYIVLEGKLEVLNASGQRLATVGTGEVVGEMSFIEARPPSATVRAMSDTVLFAVSRDVLEEQLAQDAGFAARFYKALATFLSDRLRAAGAGGSEDDDELDPNILDTLSQAGARFDRLVAQLYQRGL